MTTTTKTATVGQQCLKCGVTAIEVHRLHYFGGPPTGCSHQWPSAETQPPEHDAGLRDGRRLHTNDCVRQRAKFGARSKAGDVCSCDADAEQLSDPDAERIAQLENEGLTHSDAVGVMEAEKLARQPEPAAGEERAEATPTPWETSVIGSEDGDQWDICGEGGGDMIADLSGCGDSGLQEANAKLIIRAVNSHTQLVAALESLIAKTQTLPQPATHDGLGLADALAEAREALRLAKDGE